MTDGGLPTLEAAVAWLDAHWSLREAPLRLHVAEHDGWGLAFAPTFARYLDARPTDLMHVPIDPGRPSAPYDVVYRYPMWLALERLAADDRAKGRLRSSATLVLTAATRDFDYLDSDDLLRAIRRLHERYVASPADEYRKRGRPKPAQNASPSWIDKSESQRKAEGERAV